MSTWSPAQRAGLLALPVRRGALEPVVLTLVSVIKSPSPLARGVFVLLGAEARRVTRREWLSGQAGVPV